MGTRHLVCVVAGGEVKVAQYGQWDGYPSGQGRSVLDFVRGIVSQGREGWFLERVTGLGVHDDGGPEFDRDTGAEILNMVLTGTRRSVTLSTGFAADSLFCEWAYVVDLDDRTLEAYKGFQKAPHKLGRFHEMGNPENVRRKASGLDCYYPVALAATFGFDALPTAEAFVELLESEETK